MLGTKLEWILFIGIRYHLYLEPYLHFVVNRDIILKRGWIEMGQTKKGARKAVKTMRERYGRNIFKEIGRKGGNPILLKKDSKWLLG